MTSPYGLTDADRADLRARLATWFGGDEYRQAFLVSHLAAVVDRIKADAYAAGLAAREAEARPQWAKVAEGEQGGGDDAWQVTVFREQDCDHQWIDRPESDTIACDICGEER